MKALKRFLGLAGALLLAGLVVAILWIRSARPVVDGEIRLPDLAAPIEIARDSLGVAYIRAEDEPGLLFAQGWVHAQDRLWQMELFRRLAEGRLAGILGAGFIETDRFLRTVGVWRAAGRQLEATPPETLRLLEAYAAGVNAWLAVNRDALPPEFLLLRTRPDPWTPRHTLAIEKIMAWDLSPFEHARQMAAAARRLDPDRLRYLTPEDPDWAPTILAAPPAVPDLAARLIDAHSITRASNAWVIAGDRTRSGKPILANDMHLALRAPAIWYLMALHGGGIDVTGMTLPGAPYVIAGHNRAVAWGFTNAMVDDADFFVERIDPADPGRYLVPGGTERFDVVAERIPVRGGDTVQVEIRLTRHGPVLDGADAEPGTIIALAWDAASPSTTFDALRLLNRAGSAADVAAATLRFETPHQNVVFADTMGAFGYRMAGRVPLRGSGRPPPLAPVPGWTGEWDWNGYLPREDHPAAMNPASGYVVTANNRQTAGDVADRITRRWEPPFRAARIQQMIEQAGVLDADAVHAMQLDVHDAFAERYIGLALDAARRVGDPATESTLATWDLRADRASRGAALFYAWLEALRDGVRVSLYGANEGWLPRNALRDMLDRAALPWLGTDGIAAFDSVSDAAFEAAMPVARERTWGELHRVRSVHALSGVPILDRLLRLDVGPAPGGGSPTTVNVSQHDGAFPADAAYGPSQRHVVDLGDLDGSGGFILPTGQSGIPFDRHYRDQFPRWLEGGLWRIPLDPETAGRRFVHRLILTPDGP